ncbi:MAG: small nuclear ribonucleoprotein (Sm) [Candidatus Nezhaarchaeota archaeon]|nr:small nuclear ribonucleoprotein (Sm) [Candidatus Nezhaarchaeota archaeon]MCX8141989.1 small nuclear ribonucleoprotein (Sm) [Candidatus Nezhaarchaeota archaeon]MDW8050230.1 LSM domain-containing protein [Nitrososphaerota archaeon]
MVKSDPLKMLMKAINEEIIVRLKDGRSCRGILEKSDQCMNLLLNDAEEINEDDEPIAKYGKVLIRGSNILFVKLRE